jgi:hypothetical protein
MRKRKIYWSGRQFPNLFTLEYHNGKLEWTGEGALLRGVNRAAHSGLCCWWLVIPTIPETQSPKEARHRVHTQIMSNSKKNDNGLLSSTRLGFCWVSDCRQFTKVWALPQTSLKMKLGRCHEMLLETENSAHQALVLTCPQVTTWQVMWLSPRWSKLSV